MTPEQLKLALTDWFDRLDFDRSNEATRHAEYAELLDIIRDIPPDAMVKEALELADKIEGWSPEKWKPLTLIAHERRLAVAALRATPDARVKEALQALYEWYDRDGSVGGASEIFEDNRDALSRQPGTGEAAQKSAPAALGSLPSGESDPSVTLDCAGADTDNINPEVRERQDAEATRQRWRDHAASTALNATHIKLIDIIYGNSSPNMTTEACSDQAHRIAEALISAGLVTPAQGSPMVAHGGGHNDTICIAERKGTALPSHSHSTTENMGE